MSSYLQGERESTSTTHWGQKCALAERPLASFLEPLLSRIPQASAGCILNSELLVTVFTLALSQECDVKGLLFVFLNVYIKMTVLKTFSPSIQNSKFRHLQETGTKLELGGKQSATGPQRPKRALCGLRHDGHLFNLSFRQSNDLTTPH